MGEQPTVVAGPGPLVTTSLIISASVAALGIITATGLVAIHPAGGGALTYALSVFGVATVATVLLLCHREARERVARGQRAILAATEEARVAREIAEDDAVQARRQLAALIQGIGARLDALAAKSDQYRSDEYSEGYDDSRVDVVGQLSARIDALAAVVAALTIQLGQPVDDGGVVTPFQAPAPGAKRSGR
ncbi:MAG: hypothetical protein HOQ43_10720 [Glycomyces artemisiae]|uniref:Uncharacterized protein n=1 Tax=Glycomyces artemisiae TaxID=1076443 RepID=A0A850CB66_9ACTN|nr:hypothetical protein [Glycomyces artemisiae]